MRTAVGVSFEIGEPVVEALSFQQKRIGYIERPHFAGWNIMLICDHVDACRDMRRPLIARDVRDLKK